MKKLRLLAATYAARKGKNRKELRKSPSKSAKGNTAILKDVSKTLL